MIIFINLLAAIFFIAIFIAARSESSLIVENGLSDKYRVTFITDYLWPITLIWIRQTKMIVEGSSTVWHHYPDGNRCGTSLEYELTGIIKRHEMVLAARTGIN